jgi:hypothetical protein
MLTVVNLEPRMVVTEPRATGRAEHPGGLDVSTSR